jgi:NAD(P)-dependent dehydrogenase (short-subunit alcohol dehydrogenase family)
MDLQLAGKVAVVTGASKGIGLAVVRGLVTEGAHVIAGARSLSPEIEGMVAAGTVEFVSVDLSTPDGPAALVQHASAGGGIDILVNNVGAVSPRPDGVTSVTDAEWERTINLTLMAAVRTIREAVPELARRGGGSIVTISSVNATLPDPLVADYSAAKSALTSFSKSLSKDLGPSGIRVNTISPGPVATSLWLGENGVAQAVSHAGGGTPEEVAAAAAAASVTGRFTRPEEVADLVLVLASDRFGNVTGADFRIDGGLIDTI